MSIIIEGMDKPGFCGDCCFLDETQNCILFGERGTYDDCPIIQIPVPHGRLLDENLIHSVIVMYRDGIRRVGSEECDNRATGANAIGRIIESMPAVIEAEG